jgi:hypothetical protein
MITQTVTVALGCFQAHWRLLLTVHLILALPSFLYGRLKLVGIVPDIYEFGDHIAPRPDTSLLGENILMFFMQDFLWDQVRGLITNVTFGILIALKLGMFFAVLRAYRRNEKASVKDLITSGFSSFLPCWAYMIFVTPFTETASLLFMLPAIVFGTFFFVAGPTAAIEKAPVWTAVSRSVHLTQKYRLQIFSIVLVFTVVQFICGFFGAIFIQQNGIPDTVLEWVFYYTVRYATSSLVGFIYVLTTISAYLYLRDKKEGSPDTLVIKGFT